MSKGIVACSAMIAGLVLLIIAFFGPWYTIQGSGLLGANYNVNFFLSRLEAKGTFLGQVISVSMNYAEAKVNTQNLGINTNSFAVIDTAMVLTIIAMISAVIAVTGMFAFVFEKGKPVYTKYLGGGFGMLAFILALVPALYFMSTGFAQESTGFWFSESILGVTLSGGPGYAWYLMIMTAIIVLIASAAMLAKKIGSPETAPPEVT